MKLILKNSDNPANEKVNITKKVIPCLDSSWHYHSEYELLYISKSTGVRFVGDSVSQFSPGDLVLVGPYLPHLWRNDPSYYKDGESTKVKTIIIKFTKDFMGEGTLNMPEFSDIYHLLDQSKYGITFDKAVSDQLSQDLINIIDLPPAGQMIKLMELLHILSMTDKKGLLSATDMRQYTTENSERLDTVLKFISDNYANYINLQDVADVACMTTNSFCRFFKKMTHKSFTQFLNEVRIKNASRILVQEDYPVSEICYMVGYKSITNFNMQFKQIMGVTPKDYRQAM